MAELLKVHIDNGDTFLTLISVANNTAERVDSISPNANTVSANTVTTDIFSGNTVNSNVVNVTTINPVTNLITLTGNTNLTGTRVELNNANTNIFSGYLNITANSIFQGSNTNIFSNHLNVTANANFQATVNLSGLETAASDIAGAINEVNNNTIVYSIALG